MRNRLKGDDDGQEDPEEAKLKLAGGSKKGKEFKISDADDILMGSSDDDSDSSDSEKKKREGDDSDNDKKKKKGIFDGPIFKLFLIFCCFFYVKVHFWWFHYVI